MSIKNIYRKTEVLGNKFLEDTGNKYRLVSKRPYTHKEGRLPNGVLVTLQITQDNNQYKAGEDNMVMETFDATILCGTHNVDVNKGDYVSLHDFFPEWSYYIDFSYILRFGRIEKITDPKK